MKSENEKEAIKTPKEKKKVDLIFNATQICPWDCTVCCVDAVHVSKSGSKLIMRSKGLEHREEFALDKKHSSIYAQAAHIRAQRNEELSLEKKRKVVDNLEGFDARIDISGGDVLLVPENVDLMRYASKKLGRRNVTLTATGAGLAHCNIDEIASLISEYNFTFDSESVEDEHHRPNGYALGNLKKAKQFVERGCQTRAELPLSTDTISKDKLTRIYMALHDANVSKLLVMRLFPVGRGKLLKGKIPTKAQYLEAIAILQELSEKHGDPVIKLQCALRHLLSGNGSDCKNPCDLLHESFGITPEGKLLASPWAYNENGEALHSTWVLGDLVHQKLSDILDSEKAIKLQERLNENHGHCKVFAYLNSKKSEHLDRMFDRADELYS